MVRHAYNQPYLLGLDKILIMDAIAEEYCSDYDSVIHTFGQTLARENVMGAIGTVQFVFQFAINSVSTTQEVLNSAIYLGNYLSDGIEYETDEKTDDRVFSLVFVGFNHALLKINDHQIWYGTAQ